MECNLRAKELFPPYCLSENWKIGIYYIFLFNHSHWWFIGKDTTFVHLSEPHSSSVNSNYLLSMFASFTCLICIHSYKASMPPKKYKNLFSDYTSKKVRLWRKAWHCSQKQRRESNTTFFHLFQTVNCLEQFSWGPLKFLERSCKWVLDFWVYGSREKKKKS